MSGYVKKTVHLSSSDSAQLAIMMVGGLCRGDSPHRGWGAKAAVCATMAPPDVSPHNMLRAFISCRFFKLSQISRFVILQGEVIQNLNSYAFKKSISFSLSTTTKQKNTLKFLWSLFMVNFPIY